MEAKHMDVARIHELTCSVGASRTEGVTAALSLSTPHPAVAALALVVLGVVVSVSAVVMLAGGFPPQQSAELALVEGGGGCLAAEA